MTTLRTATDDGKTAIAVAVAITNYVVRDAVAAALATIGGRIVRSDHLGDAVVVVADHLARWEIPSIIVGSRSLVEQALAHGASGALQLPIDPVRLRILIEAADHGLVCSERQIAGQAPVGRESPGGKQGGAETLSEFTPREAEVLALLISGAGNKMIARELDISVHTAKFHVASVIAKLGASGRTDAVARALQSGFGMI